MALVAARWSDEEHWHTPHERLDQAKRMYVLCLEGRLDTWVDGRMMTTLRRLPRRTLLTVTGGPVIGSTVGVVAAALLLTAGERGATILEDAARLSIALGVTGLVTITTGAWLVLPGESRHWIVTAAAGVVGALASLLAGGTLAY